MSEPVYRFDEIYGYDILIPPGIIGNPPPDGYLVRVGGQNEDRVTVKILLPLFRVETA
jgi:hypothetical protein